MANLIERITSLLEEHGYEVSETNRSLITTCPQCGKEKHLYIFKEGKNNSKCMKCGQTYSLEALVVALTDCSFADARKLLHAGELIKANEGIRSNLSGLQERPQWREALRPIVLPPNFYTMDREEANDGKAYLLNRGVHADVFAKFDLRYCPAMERVIFPVAIEGDCIGWQGRDISGRAELRFTSPSGFTKARVLFGYDQVDETRDHLVLVEGPVDCLRVAAFFPTVCSMGKMVSNDQIALIKKMKHVKKLYLGLDPDAFELFDVLAAEFEPDVEVYIYQPPAHRKDFGECTDKEILQAFKDARRYNKAGALYSVLKG